MMPKPLRYALIWSHEYQHYTLTRDGQPEQGVFPADQAAFARWLDEYSAFVFCGQAGRISVLKEARRGGTGYWYAHRTQHRHTRKCYLGRSSQVTLARLEEVAQRLASSSFPAALVQEPTALLSSKLTPPRLPTVLVERERLFAALDAALATRLSLVCAPAGFGKTTLLTTWASRRKIQVVWLSLDDLDTTPKRFWVALIAALRRCPSFTPSFGASPMALLQSPQSPPLSTMLTALLQELESGERHCAPIVLIVDDYQVIGDPAIHEGMTFFLEHLPVHLHVILASRVDPDLPLARWRVRGQLCEIRADELRFQESEASRFLGQMLSPPLSQEEAQRLVSRTEGWIAGLHLAALALQKRADRAAFLQAFTGSQRYLLDYVQEEILARLPTPVRDFLLHTAILSRMDASVCQAVTAAPERRASQQMLVFLERANLFLVPLDEERRSYRLHELFREALLTVLHTTQPELVSLLYRRATSFYEAQGEWAEAITHALQAADYSTAARLLGQTVEQFWLRGEATTMARWVMALPQSLMREHARLVLTTALYLLNTVIQTTEEQRVRVYKEVQQLMARAETALLPQVNETVHQFSVTGPISPPEARDARAAEEALLHRRLHLLRTLMVLGEIIATRTCERLDILHEEMQELDRDEEAIWQMVPLFCSFILHYKIRREGALLVPQLLEARRRGSQSASHFATLKVMQWLAQVALEAGQLHLAYEESQAALDRIEQIAGYALLKGYFEIVLALVLYQWNRLEEARGRLQTALHDAAIWQQLDVLGWGYAGLMQVELARGDRSMAELAQHEAEQLILREGFGIYPSWLPTLRAQWWLAQGQLTEASDWAAGVVFQDGTWEVGSYEAFPVVIRVHFARHSFPAAVTMLERWSAHLDRPANMAITITYLAQSLVALHQVGESEQARRVAVRLFALTELEGYLRVYLDEGEPMREALQALLSPYSQQQELAPSTRAYIAKLLAAFEQEADAAGTSRQAALPPALPASGKSAHSPNSLTAREVEVLRLVASGLTDAQIAEQLVISSRTVNVHLTSMYRKLSVSSRVAATRYAIEHHLA